MTYEHMRELAGAGWLPVAAVHAVQDPEGRVLYDDVSFGQYQLEADLEEIRLQLDPVPPDEFVRGAVALFGCKLRHRSHARSES